MNDGFLDKAADVRAERRELDEMISKVREAGGDWSSFAAAATDAVRIAEDGMRNSSLMLGRFLWLAAKELERAQAMAIEGPP